MTNKNFIVFSFLALLLTGCGSMPRTPEVLVENVKSGSMLSDKDAYVVKRPLAQVTGVLKEKSAECLNQKIETSWWERGLHRRMVTAFTPRVTASKERTRLTLQSKIIEGSTEVGDPPPEGWYMMVVDAYAVDKNTTRIESYFQQSSYKGAFTATKAWVTGANMGCPDLTQ